MVGVVEVEDMEIGTTLVVLRKSTSGGIPKEVDAQSGMTVVGEDTVSVQIHGLRL